MAYITCEDLTIGYDGRAILSGLQFLVDRGDYLCIVGENGAGKSTLMRTLLGLQPPVNGNMMLGDGLRREDIGYLPQQTEVQRDFPASVWEIVLSGCQVRCGLRPFYNKVEKMLAKETIRKLGIEALEKRCYRELSGGQQQRVLLARALCAAGKVLVLDEPVAGLDPKVTAELYQLIASLNQEGMTILMVSHDLDAAVRYASHILHIGKNWFFGTKEEYLNHEVGKGFLNAAGGDVNA